MNSYDIIVIGAGHAGCEVALVELREGQEPAVSAYQCQSS